MNPSNEFQPLIDELFVEEVVRARAIPPEKKFMLGFELFEWSLLLMRDGVRAQYPDFGPEQVDREVSRRFACVRKVQEYGIYQSLP